MIAVPPSRVFARFGRTTGLRLLLRGQRAGAALVLRPVESVRYFEFPFALRCFPADAVRCLDVSSPRLFSLYVARRHPGAQVRMINPDARDIAATEQIVRALRIPNVRLEVRGVDAVAGERSRYDAIWAISVVEHIAGPYEDREAVRWMYDALDEGGRLILTVPVDRAFREEYRDRSDYGTQPPVGGRFFFQRLYDRAAIWSRIVGSIGREPDVVAWFGERTPGHFAAYERVWMAHGLAATVDDRRDIAENYATFPSWESMPGMGVCGLMFEKPR